SGLGNDELGFGVNLFDRNISSASGIEISSSAIDDFSIIGMSGGIDPSFAISGMSGGSDGPATSEVQITPGNTDQMSDDLAAAIAADLNIAATSNHGLSSVGLTD